MSKSIPGGAPPDSEVATNPVYSLVGLPEELGGPGLPEELGCSAMAPGTDGVGAGVLPGTGAVSPQPSPEKTTATLAATLAETPRPSPLSTPFRSRRSILTARSTATSQLHLGERTPERATGSSARRSNVANGGNLNGARSVCKRDHAEGGELAAFEARMSNNSNNLRFRSPTLDSSHPLAFEETGDDGGERAHLVSPPIRAAASRHVSGLSLLGRLSFANTSSSALVGDRSHFDLRLLLESFSLLGTKSGLFWRRGFKIRYLQDEGVDWGALTKGWADYLATEMLHLETGLFNPQLGTPGEDMLFRRKSSSDRQGKTQKSGNTIGDDQTAPARQGVNQKPLFLMPDWASHLMGRDAGEMRVFFEFAGKFFAYCLYMFVRLDMDLVRYLYRVLLLPPPRENLFNLPQASVHKLFSSADSGVVGDSIPSVAPEGGQGMGTQRDDATIDAHTLRRLSLDVARHDPQFKYLLLFAQARGGSEGGEGGCGAHGTAEL